ncbi:hypothetical protein PIB30_082892 [Stylosanthes scabra]|uniref:Uncharacterized protein n=1 Tax=Stylosanthes scabra TaxID=79078 RepID=A0ABU6USU9_9FABA|nr:hypothetical protein [Stylosanthes scabra]
MGVKGAETGHDESAKQVKKREDGVVNGGGGLVGDSSGVRVVECGGYGGRRVSAMVEAGRLGGGVAGSWLTKVSFDGGSGFGCGVVVIRMRRWTAVMEGLGGGWCSKVMVKEDA